MLIKVCGMREPDNIQALLQLPVDFIGFIFYERSPRFAAGSVLAKWMSGHAEKFGSIRKVGVFVNAEVETILNAVYDYQLDYVQLHGVESPEYCRELLSLWEMGSLRSAQLIKAFAVDEDFDFGETQPFEGMCAYFLFDTKGESHGGTGRRFSWDLLKKYQGVTPFLLSGGIDEGAAPEIRELNHPQLAGVDLNSRFEIKPGLKDIESISRFIQRLNE